MILIFSDSNDQSTCHIINWLLYYKKEYILLTDETYYSILELDPSGYFKIEIEGKIISSDIITSIWYRRGRLTQKVTQFKILDSKPNISKFFASFLKTEKTLLSDFIQLCLFEKKSINNQYHSSVNKLIILKKAQEIGLLIPDTIVTSNKDTLIAFKDKNKKIITKTIHEGLFYNNDGLSINVYTEIVDNKTIKLCNQNFAPSLFQKFIDKKFEIRAFFLKQKFYSMAIFSQNNCKTKIDFRHYDELNPNRCIPFKLPKAIEKQLLSLMISLNLSSGSIDMIYSKEKKFYFLEVNPIGQFGMVSYPCNYYLERKIAEYLQ